MTFTPCPHPAAILTNPRSEELVGALLPLLEKALGGRPACSTVRRLLCAGDPSAGGLRVSRLRPVITTGVAHEIPSFGGSEIQTELVFVLPTS